MGLRPTGSTLALYQAAVVQRPLLSTGQSSHFINPLDPNPFRVDTAPPALVHHRPSVVIRSHGLNKISSGVDLVATKNRITSNPSLKRAFSIREGDARTGW